MCKVPKFIQWMIIVQALLFCNVCLCQIHNYRRPGNTHIAPATLALLRPMIAPLDNPGFTATPYNNINNYEENSLANARNGHRPLQTLAALSRSSNSLAGGGGGGGGTNAVGSGQLGRIHVTGPDNDENQRNGQTYDGDYSAIPGTAGIDYPVYGQVPLTNFDCGQQAFPGYYADVEAQCQVFHICALNRTYSFLCPNGTIFSQEVYVCVWWHQYDCLTSPNYYANNAYIYDYEKIPPTVTPPSNILLNGRGHLQQPTSPPTLFHSRLPQSPTTPTNYSAFGSRTGYRSGQGVDGRTGYRSGQGVDGTTGYRSGQGADGRTLGINSNVFPQTPGAFQNTPTGITSNNFQPGGSTFRTPQGSQSTSLTGSAYGSFPGTAASSTLPENREHYNRPQFTNESGTNQLSTPTRSGVALNNGYDLVRTQQIIHRQPSPIQGYTYPPPPSPPPSPIPSSSSAAAAAAFNSNFPMDLNSMQNNRNREYLPPSSRK